MARDERWKMSQDAVCAKDRRLLNTKKVSVNYFQF
jgi:hypothetical protein